MRTELATAKLLISNGSSKLAYAGWAYSCTDGVLPGDSGGELAGQDSQSSEHSPTSVDELALPETLESEDLAVWLERVCGDLIDN
jgi:hypothetical protein